MESVLQRFVDLNKDNFAYLGVSAGIENRKGKLALKLVTSNFVGAIPVFSPMNGKLAGDLVVAGRFGENAGELISLLDNSIRPEYSDRFKLVLDSQMIPPIFIECCKYIELYIEAERLKWRKFSNTVKKQTFPSSSTLWGDYALRIAKNPMESNMFMNKNNILTTEHEEWNKLNYVLKIAISELESGRTPQRVRLALSDRITSLKTKLRDKFLIQPTGKLQTKMSDPLTIKNLKGLANVILSSKSNEKLAWRMDYSEFFERYVQYLFASVAQKKGATELNNYHYNISCSKKPSWLVSYLEPDIILQKEQQQLIVDAKYKSHIYNWGEDSDELSDTFRHDLHQVLAYSSFTTSQNKYVMLVYPFSKFVQHKAKVINNLTHAETNVFLIGIPLEKNKIEAVEKELCDLITANSILC
ncbi:MAG: hypothetical protein MJZ74_09065 [Muribaculaceae bacterium]|nr:hypothetical protein [Muribaculaceae bacterium]